MPITWLQKSSQSLLDLLLPPRCVHCKAQQNWLCAECTGKIDIISGPVCEKCGTPTSSNPSTFCPQCQKHPAQFIDGVRAAAYFDHNPIRSAIHTLKYQNHKAIAQILARFLLEACQRYNLEADVIVPVPLHAARMRERGYNQSLLLAKQLGSYLNVPVDAKTLVRTRQTKSQMTLDARARHQNVAQAFACANDQLAGRRVLLIDDVCTTGSTLDACAEALKQSNTALVWGLTLAKAR